MLVRLPRREGACLTIRENGWWCLPLRVYTSLTLLTTPCRGGQPRLSFFLHTHNVPYPFHRAEKILLTNTASFTAARFQLRTTIVLLGACRTMACCPRVRHVVLIRYPYFHFKGSLQSRPSHLCLSLPLQASGPDKCFSQSPGCDFLWLPLLSSSLPPKLASIHYVRLLLLHTNALLTFSVCSHIFGVLLRTSGKSTRSAIRCRVHTEELFSHI